MVICTKRTFASGAVQVAARRPRGGGDDPTTLSDFLVHKLSVEAKRRIEEAGLSRREVARRLHTSLPQLYRLLDPANTRKSINQLASLLHVLDCDVKLVVKAKPAA